MNPSSKKTSIILFIAILVAAGIVAVAIHFGSKNNSGAPNQSSIPQTPQTQNPETPAPDQTDQASQDSQSNSADQISAIDKAAQEQLGGDYKIAGASFVAAPKDKNGVKVEVGDLSAKEVLPELTLSRWDETKMTLKPNLDGIAAQDKKVSFAKDQIKFDTPKVAYSLENLPSSDALSDGGFEYNIILKEKPQTNVVSLNIDTQNLDFFYQPSLKDEIKVGDRNGLVASVTDTEAKDKDGNIIASRPDDAVGSYAVYYKNGVSGDYSAEGGKNYMTGKAFHIYRPKIEDATGKWVWGDLHIDEKTGLLTVTIPQDFLDSAVYPVTHAAGLQFGYSHQGSGTDYIGAIWPGYFKSYAYGGSPATPASNGTLSSMTFYCYKKGLSPDFCPALYDEVAGVPHNRIYAVNSGCTAMGASMSPITTNITGAVVAGTQYWLGAKPTAGGGYNTQFYYAYDTNGGALEMYYGTSDQDWPAIADTFHQQTNERVSIYATYTPSSTPSGVPINIKRGVNFNKNVNFK